MKNSWPNTIDNPNPPIYNGEQDQPNTSYCKGGQSMQETKQGKLPVKN